MESNATFKDIFAMTASLVSSAFVADEFFCSVRASVTGTGLDVIVVVSTDDDELFTEVVSFELMAVVVVSLDANTVTKIVLSDEATVLATLDDAAVELSEAP